MVQVADLRRGLGGLQRAFRRRARCARPTLGGTPTVAHSRARHEACIAARATYGPLAAQAARRAYVLMEIARKFAPQRAKDGESKLRAGLEYLRTTPEHDRPADLGRIAFEIPDGKQTKSLRWKDATAEDIERATVLLRRKLRKESARIPREARSLRATLERQVRDVEIGLRQPSGHEDLTDLVVTLAVPYQRLGQTCRSTLEILRKTSIHRR